MLKSPETVEAKGFRFAGNGVSEVDPSEGFIRPETVATGLTEVPGVDPNAEVAEFARVPMAGFVGVDPTEVFEGLEAVPTGDGEVAVEDPPEAADGTDGAAAVATGVAVAADDAPNGADDEVAGVDGGVVPDDIGAVIFGGGGATALPELKSASKITAIPADLNGLSVSLMEYRVC